MKIGVLGLRNPEDSKDFKKFKEASKQLGISLLYYKPSDLIIEIGDTIKILDYNLQPLKVNGILNWMPYENSYQELHEAFISCNIPCINSLSAVKYCRNKLLTNIILNRNNLPQPKTVFLKKLNTIPELSLTPPIVYKKKNGSKGIDARKLDTYEEANIFLEEMLERKDIYLQDFIKNGGWDLRVVVIGSQVIGAIKKYSRDGEWRTHIAHGGFAEPYEMTEDIKKMCLEAVKALKLDFAGIDIIQGTDGNNFILEVNSVPGMTIFTETTGINIAYEILKYFIEEIIDHEENRLGNTNEYYETVSSKMIKTKVIEKSPSIKPFVPETHYLTLDNLRNLLVKYPLVCFKPDRGGGGKNVGLVHQGSKPDQHTIHFKTKYYKDMTLEEVYKFILLLAPEKRFVLQKGISLITYNNCPVDIRVFLQKPYEQWEITGIIAKVAAKNKMITNLHSGGTGMPLLNILKANKYPESQIKSLRSKLNKLSYHVAMTLSDTYPGLRELGIDIGIDSDLYPWIFEVNTKPRYAKFASLDDLSMYNTIHKYHKLIHNSIKYYNRDGNITIKSNEVI